LIKKSNDRPVLASLAYILIRCTYIKPFSPRNHSKQPEFGKFTTISQVVKALFKTKSNPLPPKSKQQQQQLFNVTNLIKK